MFVVFNLNSNIYAVNKLDEKLNVEEFFLSSIVNTLKMSQKNRIIRKTKERRENYENVKINTGTIATEHMLLIFFFFKD